jgi:predicted MFS family arabinose efflux permease
MTSRWTVGIMAVGCGLSVANLYYNQPLLAQMGHDFSVSAQQMGVVSTLGQAGYGLGLLLFVPLGDLLERRRLILTMLGATTAALAATAAAPSFFWLAVASFVLGAATIVPQLIIPFAAGIAEPTERGKVVGAVMSGLLIGILAARTVSGLVGSHLGWRAMYGIAAFLMIGLMFAIRAWLPPSSPTVSGASYRSLMRSLIDLVRDVPVLRHSALFGGMTFAAFSVFWTTLAFHLAAPPFGYGSDVVGLFGLIGAAGAFAAPLIGIFADRRSARWTIGFGIVLTLGSFLIFGVFGSTLWGMILGVLLLDLGVQCSHISNQTRIYGLLPEARSRLNTVYMVAFFFGGAFGSFSGALGWSRFGWTGVCLVGSSFLVVALAVFIATGENRRFLGSKTKAA